MLLVCLKALEARPVRLIMPSDDELARGGRDLDERVLLGQGGGAEPAENRDATWSGLEDPHRRGGLKRRGQEPLREVEDERPGLNEIVADRPAIRGQDREGGRG